MTYEGGFRLVIDPKSLLYLFGMRCECFQRAGCGGPTDVECRAPSQARLLGRAHRRGVPVPESERDRQLRLREELWRLGTSSPRDL